MDPERCSVRLPASLLTARGHFPGPSRWLGRSHHCSAAASSGSPGPEEPESSWAACR
jgi:hypothetical protein